MARPLLACLLVSACTVPNPWFGVPGDATDSTGEPATSTPDTTSPTATPTTGEPPPTTAPDATSTTDETTVGLSSGHTTGSPPDLPHDDTTTGADTTTTGDTTSTADASTGDDSTGPPIESDSDGPILPPCDAASEKVIACYDFENEPMEEMLLLDGSMYQHAGVMAGPDYDIGIEGQGLVITGSTLGSAEDFLALNPPAISIAAWVFLKNEAPLKDAAIVEKPGQYALTIRKDAGLTCTINGVTITQDAPFPLSEWAHVACVYAPGDPGSVSLYLKGAKLASTDAMGDIPMGPGPLHVGCGGPACQVRLIGARLDRIRLWNTALDANAVCMEAGAC